MKVIGRLEINHGKNTFYRDVYGIENNNNKNSVFHEIRVLLFSPYSISKPYYWVYVPSNKVTKINF